MTEGPVFRIEVSPTAAAQIATLRDQAAQPLPGAHLGFWRVVRGILTHALPLQLVALDPNNRLTGRLAGLYRVKGGRLLRVVYALSEEQLRVVVLLLGLPFLVLHVQVEVIAFLLVLDWQLGED